MLSFSSHFGYQKEKKVLQSTWILSFSHHLTAVKLSALSWLVIFLQVGCWAVKWTVRESDRTDRTKPNQTLSSAVCFRQLPSTSTLARIYSFKHPIWFQRKLLTLNLECSIFIGGEICNICSVVSGIWDTYCCYLACREQDFIPG